MRLIDQTLPLWVSPTLSLSPSCVKLCLLPLPLACSSLELDLLETARGSQGAQGYLVEGIRCTLHF